METFIGIAKLNSYLGQLADLKAGLLKEIVILKGIEADELTEIVKSALENEKAREQMEKDHAKDERV